MGDTHFTLRYVIGVEFKEKQKEGREVCDVSQIDSDCNFLSDKSIIVLFLI